MYEITTGLKPEYEEVIKYLSSNIIVMKNQVLSYIEKLVTKSLEVIDEVNEYLISENGLTNIWDAMIDYNRKANNAISYALECKYQILYTLNITYNKIGNIEYDDNNKEVYDVMREMLAKIKNELEEQGYASKYLRIVHDYTITRHKPFDLTLANTIKSLSDPEVISKVTMEIAYDLKDIYDNCAKMSTACAAHTTNIMSRAETNDIKPGDFERYKEINKIKFDISNTRLLLYILTSIMIQSEVNDLQRNTLHRLIIELKEDMGAHVIRLGSRLVP